MILNQDLKKRIVDISHTHNLNHIGSCLSMLDTIKEIYDEILPDDKFVLSAGHGGLALYAVIEQKYGIKKFNAGKVVTQGIHPERSMSEYIHCSTGSLGQGLPIAVGMALADRTRTVYCVISDGECAEGSIWESLRLIEDLQIGNIKVHLVANGWGAYGKIDTDKLFARAKAFCSTIKLHRVNINDIPVLSEIGNEAHYRVLDEEQYHKIMEVLNA